jgi:HSP20 family protein
MFFATTSPAGFSRHPHSPAGRSLERFLLEAQSRTQQQQCIAEQDETSFTLKFDVPGIAKEQLSIGIEGNTVRVKSREGAPRKYQLALELPQDIDLSTSDAKLADGVLTLKLGKQVPVSRLSELTIN